MILSSAAGALSNGHGSCAPVVDRAFLSIGLIDLYKSASERLLAVALVDSDDSVLVAGTIRWRRSRTGGSSAWSSSSQLLRQIASRTAGRRVLLNCDSPEIRELLAPALADAGSAEWPHHARPLRTAFWRGTTMSAIDTARAVSALRPR